MTWDFCVVKETRERWDGVLRVVLVFRGGNNCGVGTTLRFKYHAASVSKYWPSETALISPERVGQRCGRKQLYRGKRSRKQKRKGCKMTNKPFKAQWSLYAPPGLILKKKNSTFCPHSAFVCFVWIWEQTAIISLYSINWLVFITETECVYCAVRTGSLYIILRSAHTVYLCVLCGSENKQRLFPYTALTDWFL